MRSDARAERATWAIMLDRTGKNIDAFAFTVLHENSCHHGRRPTACVESSQKPNTSNVNSQSGRKSVGKSVAQSARCIAQVRGILFFLHIFQFSHAFFQVDPLS